MLVPHIHRRFWQRRPLMTAAVGALAVWMCVHGAYVPVAIAGIAWLAVAIRKRLRANAMRDAGLRARAEYEHRLSLTGDPRGLYGRYPPVQPGWFTDPQNPAQLRYFDGIAWTRYALYR